jgi:hypothetical protein
MLKITSVSESAESIVLRLDGRLVADWIPELLTACGNGNLAQRRMALDVGGLSFADAEGIRALRDLADQGLQITNGSPFLAELMRGKRT